MSPVRRRALVVTLPFALAWAVVLAVFTGLRDRLPDPLATHFGPGGEADGFTGPGAFLSVASAVLIGSGLLIALGVLRTRAALRAQRPVVAIGYGIAGLLGYAFASLLFANADAVRASRVSEPVWQLGVVFVVACATGALGWLIAGRDTAPEDGPEGSAAPARLPLADGEVATWTRTVGSPVLLFGGVGAVLLGAVLAAVGPGVQAWLIVIGLISAAPARCRVTVDRRGLTVAPWFAPWPRMRIPLARIERATSGAASALSLGGWGYRISGRGSALVFRSGDALFLRLATGREFAVTVDDAATAAALLNTLIERERGTSEQRG
ncbi:hypothetical protein [Streptomyces hygroscopicus]|uniref:hypothetical protein n=1 Tax=Streptomyces hygroscopicus TaxID=1912 RepID=UPI00379AB89B